MGVSGNIRMYPIYTKGAALTPNAASSSPDRQEYLSFDITHITWKMGSRKAGKVCDSISTQESDLQCYRKQSQSARIGFEIPVINLWEVDGPGRLDVVSRVLSAASEVGFFQVVNHGIGRELLERMLESNWTFHEMERELRASYYSRDPEKKVRLSSNFDLYRSKYANWRDTLVCVMGPQGLGPLELPPVCRDVIMEYSKAVKALGMTLFELLSEGLGLERNYLKDMECGKGHAILCHYYPPCPEPHLTMGTTRHSDPAFLTILLQDNMGGLEVLYRDRWVKVLPLPGALIVNIGDLLQLLSNDVYKSVVHRVRANLVGPRLSVAFFFRHYLWPSTRKYGPIKEILSEHRPALYKEITIDDFSDEYYSRGLGDKRKSVLEHFRLQT
ncbi:hypothetical protein MLD38_039571 [Melastoma candidum]|uniref:Uncharacterized protein n=1 Tax=Melastoma candidum TaxID=119954 RepID=A0ACB9L394_9MYRT|nr:hypothetical protein MLD38_039571 [Melastoma candidum]